MKRFLLHFVSILLVSSAITAGLPATNVTAAEEPVRAGAPRLFVLVVFDQMRGDFLVRWEPHFGKDGFRRVMTEGVWFQNCHYPYAGTVTGAGHASLLSGCTPSIHGIVGNEWYLPATGNQMNCVGSVKHQRVPMSVKAGLDGEGSASPENMRAASFGDLLKEATRGEGRIVGLSMKDRSAILPAGKKADACYWFDSATGTFITSTYYASEIHPWAAKFNAQRPADPFFNTDWTRSRSDLDYDKLIGADDVSGEGIGNKQGRIFPHPMNGGLSAPGPDFYKAIYNSPYGNDLLLSLAKTAIEAEQLGADMTPDLLTISFSSNDAVGHTWGPDSQEVFDVTLRSDAILEELLKYLDDKVGKGQYLLAISSDHGICPIPEVAKSQGKDASRVSSKQLMQGANEYLHAICGGGDSPAKWIRSFSNGWFYLDTNRLKSSGISSAHAAAALSHWLTKQTGIQAAYTREQLQGNLPADDVIGQRVQLSYFPERCGDVALVLKPNWLLGDYSTGTTHGSPYGYDTHVPLLFYGAGIKAGLRPERIPPAAIAPVFSKALGVTPPANCITPLPPNLFADP